MSIKVAVIYHDTAECVRALADAVAAVAWNTGAEVRLRRLPEATPDRPPTDAKADPPATARDLTWADVVVLGAPARDGDVVALLRRLADSAIGPATASAAREMRDEWERRTEQQVFGVFVTTPAPGTRHGGLMRSFGIVHRPASGDTRNGPERSVAAPAPSGGTDDPTLLSFDLARTQTRRCVAIAAALRAERALTV
ncbi:hypothetical protein [Embleya scabrispora]|uniref:hypothetical protein n=1 Tax=Embleya scabrispora TaxID=159449 RepID=UPI00036852FA|nr:hypothetical protein [Embleya scabrispora]MYS87358.1 hypothetical protein [Streptomyces sp. SID5474]